MPQELDSMETQITKAKFSAIASPEKDATTKRARTAKQQDYPKPPAKVKTDPTSIEELKLALQPIQTAIQSFSLQLKTLSESIDRILTRIDKTEAKVFDNELKIDQLQKRAKK
ncbi:UPF0134 protein MPN_138-like [Protopterus annectens]|uniref:UPF0134 protein MPN_138-like n=1 Tax=Protopterus annectens TaxID=7888 RepID=UPI001CFBB935|nr:UPF0134 protein MPN_138-like [Protopterus annectens]